MDQLGVSLLLELDGPSCEALEEVSSIDMLCHGSSKGATFLAMETAWVLAWERQLQMAVPLPGVSWQMEQIEVMRVIALTKCGKR